jgi:hypothetical protein
MRAGPRGEVEAMEVEKEQFVRLCEADRARSIGQWGKK